MAGLDISLERNPGGVIVHLKGAVDTPTVEDLDHSLASLESGAQKIVVLDMAGVDYVNSRGMALLIKYNDVFSRSGRRFVVGGLNNRVKPTFEMMGLLEALEVVSKPEDVFSAAPSKKPAASAPAAHTLDCPACKAKLDVGDLGYFRCSRCGTVMRVTRGWKIHPVGGKKADRVSIVIPALAKYVSVVRAGIESLSAEYLHDTRGLWPAADEVFGYIMDKAAKIKKNAFRVSVDLVADDEHFIVVVVLPPGLSLKQDEIKDHPVFKLAAKAFVKIDLSALEPSGQVLRLEK
jgi:anti-anti-sigma factor